MSRRAKITLVFASLAAAVAAVFYAFAVDGDFYAPGAMAVHFTYGEYFDQLRAHAPHRLRHDINAVFFVHKTYSIIAFAVVGFLIAPIVTPRRRIAWCMLAVGMFSTLIEIGQKLIGVRESLLSNFFDIGCGIVGGAIGGAAWNLVRRAMRRAAKR